jgi:hypothetical protein
VNVATRGDVFVLTEEQRHELQDINRRRIERLNEGESQEGAGTALLCAGEARGPRVMRCRRGGAHLSFGPPSAARAKEHTRHEARWSWRIKRAKQSFELAGWQKLEREELRTINPGGEDPLDTVGCKF